MNVLVHPGSVILVVLAGGTVAPTVLSLVKRTALTPLRLRPVDVGAVCASAGLLVGLVVVRPPESMALLLPLTVLGCAAALVDAHEGRLPDALTGPLFACTLIAGTGTAEERSVIGVTVLAAIAGIGVALLLKATISAGFGWGDAKLVPTLAVVLARHDVVVTGIVVVSVLVAVTAVILAIGADRSALVPYGPALVVGTLGAAAL